MHGKETSPEKTIKKITQILKQAGMSIEEVSWKHPVPHVWSVHVREKNCHTLCVNGKGVTRALALASALGEFMERMVSGYLFGGFALIGITAQKKFFFAPDEKWFASTKTHLPKELLTVELRKLYNPTGELKAHDVVDRMSVSCRKNTICSLPFWRMRDKRVVYFPINILDNLYASNGMAAGNTKEESCVQALSEILERYVKNTIIRNGMSLPDIPKEHYASMEHVVKAIDSLEDAGFRVLVKDASLGGRYPVVNVTIVERKSKKCFLAFGAHPSFEIALTRTVTELLQGQKVSAFRGLKKPNKNKKEVKDPSNLVAHFIDSSGVVSEDFFKKKPAYRLSPVDCVGTRREEERFLLSIFAKAKKDVYVNALSIDGFYICRIVVPGWSEVYPTEDLVHANTNRARDLASYVINLPKSSPRKLKEALSLIDEGVVGEQEIVADVLGIVSDIGSPWQRLCFGELKLLILLALKKEHEARMQLRWCFDVGCVSEVYECLACCLDEESGDFDKKVFLKARKLMNSVDVFGDLFYRSDAMRGIQAHKKILKAFLKSRMIMQKASAQKR